MSQHPCGAARRATAPGRPPPAAVPARATGRDGTHRTASRASPGCARARPRRPSPPSGARHAARCDGGRKGKTRCGKTKGYNRRSSAWGSLLHVESGPVCELATHCRAVFVWAGRSGPASGWGAAGRFLFGPPRLLALARKGHVDGRIVGERAA